MRWCFLGSHEVPDGERMLMPPRGSSHICVPCSQTPRGKFVMQDFELGKNYRYDEDASLRPKKAIERALRMGTRLKTR